MSHNPRTLRQCFHEAWRRLGYTEELIRRRDAAANKGALVGVLSILDKPAQFQPGVTEEQFIQYLLSMERELKTLPMSVIHEAIEAGEAEIAKQVGKN